MKMIIDELTETSFLLRSIGSERQPLSFTLEMQTLEAHSEWMAKIKNILFTQYDLLTAFDNPIQYQQTKQSWVQTIGFIFF